MNSDENKIGDHVLYELLVYKEWELDREKQRKVSKNALLTTKKPKNFLLSFLWSIFYRVPWPEDDLAKAASLLLPWQISVSPDGKLVAVLEDSVLELRQSKDEYTTVVGRATVPKDERPQLRKMSWSPDNNMIAIASSDGSVRIYDCFGSLIFKIPFLLSSEKSPKKLITGLEFISAREKKGEWELLIIYANGSLECYSISSIDKCALNHTSILSESGISCTSFSSRYSILYASVKPIDLFSVERKKFSTGITAWRLLNECPYYEKVFPLDDEIGISKFHGKMWTFFSFLSTSDCICKIIMAPSNGFLATLHASGIVFIWIAPSLRLHSYLEKFDFKKHKVLVPLSETGVCSHVIDIEWRKDCELIVAWKNGPVSIHDINANVVLTYFGSDFLQSLPRLASASSLHGFLALECEAENLLNLSAQYSSGLDLNSEDEKTVFEILGEVFYLTMHLLTELERFEPKRKSVKIIKRTYRLLGVKMTTPEELFERCLKNEEFERAFEICQEYGLDINKVYMRQWRTSEVNEYSIQEYLANIEDDEWVLHECLHCVPETLSGAKKLIEFGLNFTDIKSILEVESSCELSDKQKLFISSRLKLLDYTHKLQTYELIFNENSYNQTYFEKFRNQSIVSSAIDFARSAQTEAVKLLMTYHGKEVLPFWLNILDNYPESIKPSSYRDILPECDGDKMPVNWVCVEPEETSDWSLLEYASLCCDSEETQIFDEVYSFDAVSLTKWYNKRAIALEKYSTVVENAVDLLELGIERNIQGLEESLYEFKILSTLVYDLNVTIDFVTFHSKELSKKLQLFIQEPKYFSEVTLKYVHPYLEHYADKTTEKWFSLYNDFMIHHSRKMFGHVLEYFNHILNGNLHIIGCPVIFVTVLVDCIYAYEKLDQLPETESLIVETLKWLSSLSDEMRKADLHEKLFSVQNELKGANILIKNGFFKTIVSINKMKFSVEESKTFILEFTHASLRNLGPNVEEWEEFLTDLVDLQRYCLSSVSIKYCYQLYISHMLCSGIGEIITYTSKLLCCTKVAPEEHLSYDISIQLVLEAAEYYFNAAMKDNDESMNLAKTCLLLIKDENPVIQKELNLIHSVRLLYDLGLHILPLQVRQTSNKMKLIDLCFDKNKNLFRSPEIIYKLAAKLHIFNPSVTGDERCVTLRLAEEAFCKNDYQWCADFCSELIKSQYPDGWKICMKLVECDSYQNVAFKKQMVSFSILHAPTRMLPHIMNIRSVLVQKNLLLNIQTTMEFISKMDSGYDILLSQVFERMKNYIKSDNKPEIFNEFQNMCDMYFKGCIADSPRDFNVICASFNSAVNCKFCNPVTNEDEKFGLNYGLLEMINSFLQLVVMTSKDDSKTDVELFSNALNLCSILSATQDSALSLCYLLCLNNPESSQHFSNFFKESTLLYQFNFYYIALKDLCIRKNFLPESSHKVTNEFLNEGNTIECITYYKKLLLAYKNFNEASQVNSLEKGIDINRFKVDEKYKNDTIFGLALNEDENSLMLAMELAKKNGISIHEVVISHLVSLLINDMLATAPSHITEERIVEVLTDNQEDTLKRLVDTLPNIRGTNYNKLMLFFTIIKVVKSDFKIHDLNPKEHISLLKKMKSLSQEINYKDLITGMNKLNAVLKPVMNDENVLLVAKFLKSLPSSVRSKYQIGMFFCQWGIDEFFNKCMHTSFRQCILNFEALSKFFSKCSADELKYFIDNTIFAEESALSIDNAVRKHLITSLIDWCKANSSSDKFRDLLSYLQTNFDVLNRLWDEEYEDFGGDLKRYIFLLEQHFRGPSSEEELLNIMNEALLNLSLNKNDLIYLHEISGIKTSLSEIVQKFSAENSVKGIEWQRRFSWDSSYFKDTETNSDEKQVISKDESTLHSVESLLKVFQEDFGVEIEANVDFEDKDSCESFLNDLVVLSTSIDQLTIIHKFVQELPSSLLREKNEVMIKILEKLVKIIPNSELKYLLTKDILKSCSVPLQVYQQFLTMITDALPSMKMFLYWICIHSDSDVIKQTAEKLLANEDHQFCASFVELPKIAYEILLPCVCKTSLYKNVLDVLMDSEKDEILMNCLEAIEYLRINEIPGAQKNFTHLKLYLLGKKLLEEDIPPALGSFHTQLLS